MLRILILLSLASSGAAETLTLQTVAPFALEHNADLAAARLTIAEARSRLLQAGRRSNPEIESEIKPNVRGREVSVGVSLMQRLPLTNRLRLEKAISQAELTTAEAEIRDAERLLAAEVGLAAVKLLAVQAKRDLQARQIANASEIAASALKLAAVGEGSTLEAGQFELDGQQQEIGQMQTKAELISLTGELRVLLGMPAGASLSLTGSLPDAVMPRNHAAQRPDLEAARARAQAATLGISAAKAGKWEDISVGAAVEWERAEDAPDGLQNDAFVGFKFSLPLPLWNKNEGKIAEAEAAAKRAAKEAEALSLKIGGEAEAAWATMEANLKLSAEAAALLPKASQLEGLYRKAYANGQVSLTEMLRVRDRYLAVESARLDALRDFHLARIRWEAAQGRKP